MLIQYGCQTVTRKGLESGNFFDACIFLFCIFKDCSCQWMFTLILQCIRTF